MRLLILQNNQKWTTMPDKLAQIKAWFEPQLSINITLEYTSFTNIPWADDIDSNGNPFKAVDPKWYDDTIALPTLKRGFDAVLLVLEPSVWRGGLVYGLGTKPNMGIQEMCMVGNESYIYDFNGKVYMGGQFFNIVCHELCHRIYDMLGKTDNTHYYYANGRLDLLLKELEEPRINPIVEFYRNPIPTVTLTRTFDNGVQAVGELSVKDFKCFTLERPWKNSKPNISCIQKGTYICKWTFSTRFLRYMYEVTGIPNRSGIRIHSANYYTDLQGCIALGNGFSDLNKDKQVDIINSRATIKKFEDLLQKKDFKLLIK